MKNLEYQKNTQKSQKFVVQEFLRNKFITLGLSYGRWCCEMGLTTVNNTTMEYKAHTKLLGVLIDNS